ncbi:hypothetical protein OH77DRAFT_1440681, partial [Trametes cingulata]
MSSSSSSSSSPRHHRNSTLRRRTAVGDDRTDGQEDETPGSGVSTAVELLGGIVPVWTRVDRHRCVLAVPISLPTRSRPEAANISYVAALVDADSTESCSACLGQSCDHEDSNHALNTRELFSKVPTPHQNIHRDHREGVACSRVLDRRAGSPLSHRLRTSFARKGRNKLSVGHITCHWSTIFSSFAMVSVKVSAAKSTPLTRNLPTFITFDQPAEQHTIRDLKKAITAKNPKLHPSRQKLTLKGDRKALADNATLKDAGVVDGSEVTVKDLGPQI